MKGYHLDNGQCVKDCDDHCAEYGYLDAGKKWYSIWAKGCQKVCKCCDPGYYLNSTYQCVLLPANCTEADSSGACTCCVPGYKVYNGACVPIVTIPEDNCAEYGYLDISKKWSAIWGTGCRKVCKCCK